MAQRGLTDYEVLSALRVLSLSSTLEQSEKSIEALITWIEGLQVRIDTMERRLEKEDNSAKRLAKRRDLEAENRTLRLALKDAMSYKRDSL